MDTSARAIPLPDAAATAKLGAWLAESAQPGAVIALSGELGAGKTTLARGFIRQLLGADVETPSPTFTLVQAYDGPDFPVYHFDLYRLKHPDEVWELGWEDIGDGVALVEWPQQAGANLPVPHVAVQLAFEGTGRVAHVAVVS
jgi:tRNA threonylcarbamoyladenosine biosynthesis protein TsaE